MGIPPSKHLDLLAGVGVEQAVIGGTLRLARLTRWGSEEILNLDFEDGFSAFIGETGAGKSILIDAIDCVLGGKFSKDSIRTGEKSTFVEAVFSLENNNLEKILEELGIEFDNTLIISREAVISGKNIIKIN